MGIEIKTKGKAARVALSGEFTIYTAAEIKAALVQAMASADKVDVDLSGVTEVDTAGIQLMLIAKRNSDKKVVFTNHPPSVLRMVDLANLGEALGDLLVVDGATA